MRKAISGIFKSTIAVALCFALIFAAVPVVAIEGNASQEPITEGLGVPSSDLCEADELNYEVDWLDGEENNETVTLQNEVNEVVGEEQLELYVPISTVTIDPLTEILPMSDRVFLEEFGAFGIRGELYNLRSHPSAGTSSFVWTGGGQKPIFSGISNINPGILQVPRMGTAIYDISGRGFTSLRGYFGTDVTRRGASAPPEATMLILIDGNVHIRESIRHLQPPREINMPIPPGSRRVEIRLQPTSNAAGSQQIVAFGNAFFTRETPPIATGISVNPTLIPHTGGNSTICILGSNFNPSNIRIAAFLNNTGSPLYIRTPTGTATNVSATLTFPANTGTANRIYTIRFCLDGGSTWLWYGPRTVTVAGTQASAQPSATNITATPTSIAHSGGNSTITVTGSNMVPLNIRVAAFLNNTGSPLYMRTPTGTASSVSTPLTFPANTGTASRIYTIRVSLNGGSTWLTTPTATLTVSMPPGTPPSANRVYLEDGIWGELYNLRSHPAAGTSSFVWTGGGQRTIFSGISNINPGILQVPRMGTAIYDISGRGFTNLRGYFGTDVTRIGASAPPEATMLILIDGNVHIRESIRHLQPPREINMPIPLGARRVEIRLQPTSNAAGSQQIVAFGNAFFTGGMPTPAATNITANPTSIAQSGGNSTITLAGSNMVPSNVRIAAFLNNTGSPLYVQTPSGTASLLNTALTFPANTGNANRIYTIRVSLNGGSTWLTTPTATVTVVPAPASVLNGWHVIGGNVVFYRNGVRVGLGSGPNGYFARNLLPGIDFFFNNQGHLVRGLVSYGGEWHYFDSTHGTRHFSGVSGWWGWGLAPGQLRYLHANGTWAVNELVTITWICNYGGPSEARYLFDANGFLVTNFDFNLAGGLSVHSAFGEWHVMATHSFNRVGNFNVSNGGGWLQSRPGMLRYLVADGTYITGPATVVDGRTTIPADRLNDAWTVMSGNHFLFCVDGYLQFGWVYVNGNRVAYIGVNGVRV